MHSRNAISDLQALAAMPGLEQLAEVLEKHRTGRGSTADVRSLLVFAGARWAFRSASAAQSATMSTDVWEQARRSAARVGRELSVQAPTFNQLHHLRRALGDPMAAVSELAEVFVEVAVELAQSMGLLAGGGSWHAPLPGSVIYGDGSVFSPLSDVTVGPDGTVERSRAKDKPRLSPQFEGKGGKEAGTGLPLALVGVHGRQRWQRLVLAVDLFTDRDEIGAAMQLFNRVIAEANGGVTHVVYDMLMSGVHMRELALQKVVPVVAMPQAASNMSHLVLPAALQRHGFRSKGASSGSGRSRGDGAQPKARVQAHHLRMVEHTVGSRVCTHELWAVDGAPVALAPGETLSLDATYLDCRDLRWERQPNGWHPIGRFVVPCRHGGIPVEFDFASNRPGINKRGVPKAFLDWVRPLPESATSFETIAGLRSDVESVFSWMKGLLPKRRACSLNPTHFVLDVIGVALLCNAIAWDTHVAYHTTFARQHAERQARNANRKGRTS